MLSLVCLPLILCFVSLEIHAYSKRIDNFIMSQEYYTATLVLGIFFLTPGEKRAIAGFLLTLTTPFELGILHHTRRKRALYVDFLMIPFPEFDSAM
jgi:hypothetical protein